MVRKKKTASSEKTSQCLATRRMPVTSASGNPKETSKSKKKGTSSDTKNAGEASSGRGTGKQKETTTQHITFTETPASTSSTSTRIITTPSRYNHPFLRSSVKRPARNQSPTPVPTQEKAKEKEKEKDKEKGGKPGQPKTERKRWEAWSNQDKNLFFEAISEYGKDFESVQKYIEHRHKKLGYPPNQIKNKDQVRHLYYRTCHKLLKYVTPLPDQPKVHNELYALINYGELRKKLKGGLNPKYGRKLDELVSQGVTCIRFKGRNVRVKTPVCKALKKIKNPEKDEEKPTKLPARVLLELQPMNNAAWTEVQSVAHNPRLRLMVPLQKDMGSLLKFLSEKWTPHRIRLLHSLKPADKSFFSQVKLHLTKGAAITPYNKLNGRFLHANSKTPFTFVAEDEAYQKDSPNKVTNPMSNKATSKGKGNNDNKSTEASVGQKTDCLLHPDLDGPIQPMEVDLLADHHPSEPIIPDPGGLSVFGENQSIGDLLSSMTGGNLAQSNDNLSFSSLSLTFSGNHTSALSLAPPATESLEQSVPMATDSSIEFSRVTGAANAGDSAERKELEDEKKGVKEEQQEKKNVPKDELLREGLTPSTASGISVTDIYLMMGRPDALKFEYEFLKKKHPVPDVTCDHMIKKLVHLAKTSFSEVDKPKKFVSVGVVTSPIRTNTPPSKCHQGGTSRSPSTTGRSPRSTGSRGASRSSSTNSKNQGKTAGAEKTDEEETREDSNGEEGQSVQFAVPRSVAPIAARRSQEPSHAQAGQQMLQQLEQMKRPQANFLLPRMRKRQRGVKPIVVQRTILPRPLPQDGQGDRMVSMAIINSSQANMGHFMPVKVNMSSLGTVVSPRTLLRPIKPNMTGMSLSTAAGNTQTNTLPSSTGGSKTMVRRIMPVNVTNSPMSGGNIVQATAHTSLSPAASPHMASSPTPESQVNQVSTSQLANSPSPSTSSPQPLGASTPAHRSPQPIAAADSSIVILEQGHATPARPISHLDTSVLNTPIVIEKELVPVATVDDSLLGSSMLDQTLTTEQSSSAVDSSIISAPIVSGEQSDNPSPSSSNPSALHISPPEISALLDISLTASENGDGMSSISLDSTTFKTFGRNISATSPNSTTNEPLNSSMLSRDIGNISPTSSPFKSNSLGPEAQWYNGESLDISMSSLLGHLESPEKKDRSNQMSSATTPMVTSLSVPTALLSESSRDSIISHDVDTTFQVMLNESSIDYVAKFADLAAHISATPDTPHKNNIIDKALEGEQISDNPPQLDLSSAETTSGIDE